MNGLVDTSVVVDIIRRHPPAYAWYQTMSDLALPVVVSLETIEGVLNKRALTYALQILNLFDVIYLTPEDQIWASDQLQAFQLSHQIGFADCLIASTAHRLQRPLYTRNLKHMRPLLGDLAVNPY